MSVSKRASNIAKAALQAINEGAAEAVTPRQRILDAASDIVHNDRNKQYGNPEDNFHNIAEAWNAYLQAKGVVHKLRSADVPIMLVLMKTARLATNLTHDDSTIDIAGYAACLGDIQENMRRMYLRSQVDMGSGVNACAPSSEQVHVGSNLAASQTSQTERTSKRK